MAAKNNPVVDVDTLIKFSDNYPTFEDKNLDTIVSKRYGNETIYNPVSISIINDPEEQIKDNSFHIGISEFKKSNKQNSLSLYDYNTQSGKEVSKGDSFPDLKSFTYLKINSFNIQDKVNILFNKDKTIGKNGINMRNFYLYPVIFTDGKDYHIIHKEDTYLTVKATDVKNFFGITDKFTGVDGFVKVEVSSEKEFNDGLTGLSQSLYDELTEEYNTYDSLLNDFKRNVLIDLIKYVFLFNKRNYIYSQYKMLLKDSGIKKKELEDLGDKYKKNIDELRKVKIDKDKEVEEVKKKLNKSLNDNNEIKKEMESLQRKYNSDKKAIDNEKGEIEKFIKDNFSVWNQKFFGGKLNVDELGEKLGTQYPIGIIYGGFFDDLRIFIKMVGSKPEVIKPEIVVSDEYKKVYNNIIEVTLKIVNDELTFIDERDTLGNRQYIEDPTKFIQAYTSLLKNCALTRSEIGKKDDKLHRNIVNFAAGYKSYWNSLFFKGEATDSGVFADNLFDRYKIDGIRKFFSDLVEFSNYLDTRSKPTGGYDKYYLEIAERTLKELHKQELKIDRFRPEQFNKLYFKDLGDFLKAKGERIRLDERNQELEKEITKLKGTKPESITGLEGYFKELLDLTIKIVNDKDINQYNYETNYLNELKKPDDFITFYEKILTNYIVLESENINVQGIIKKIVSDRIDYWKREIFKSDVNLDSALKRYDYNMENFLKHLLKYCEDNKTVVSDDKHKNLYDKISKDLLTFIISFIGKDQAAWKEFLNISNVSKYDMSNYNDFFKDALIYLDRLLGRDGNFRTIFSFARNYAMNFFPDKIEDYGNNDQKTLEAILKIFKWYSEHKDDTSKKLDSVEIQKFQDKIDDLKDEIKKLKHVEYEPLIKISVIPEESKEIENIKERIKILTAIPSTYISRDDQFELLKLRKRLEVLV